MSGPAGTFDTAWSNFGNWLNSSQGFLFYLGLAWMITLIAVLIILLRMRRTGGLGRFAATLVWLVFGLPPVTIGVLILTSSPYMAILLLTMTVPLFAGIIILATAKAKTKLPSEA